jgi:pyruvate/2-oxoglutarate dehydrogenase complex dihydrolipoamide acyltransferase (E2) component
VGVLHRIRVPDADIDAARASLVNWLVRRGAKVNAGERVAEILVGEVLLEATAPAAGKLVEKCVEVDQPVVAGQIVAWVEGENGPNSTD